MVSLRDSSPVSRSDIRRRRTDRDDDSEKFYFSRTTHYTKTLENSGDESDDSQATFRSCDTSLSTSTRTSPARSECSKWRESPAGRRKRRRRSCCGYVTCVTKLLVVMPLLTLLCLLTIGFLSKEAARVQCHLDTLSATLYANIFGQETSITKIFQFLTEFCEDYIPGEPLVLVFWGQTGVGKTLAATLLAEHFGVDSLVVPSEMFNASKYRDWLEYKTPHERPHLYAFDDIELTSEVSSLVRSTQALSLYSGPLVLILTTSMESGLLNDSFMEYSSKGDILKEFQYGGAPPAFLEELRDLNPVLLPFLPLTRTHVKLCIEKRLEKLKISRDVNYVEKIASEFDYFNDGKRLFSKIGCKRLNDMIFRVVSP